MKIVLRSYRIIIRSSCRLTSKSWSLVFAGFLQPPTGDGASGASVVEAHGAFLSSAVGLLVGAIAAEPEASAGGIDSGGRAGVCALMVGAGGSGSRSGGGGGGGRHSG